MKIGSKANWTDEGEEVLSRLRSGEVIPLYYQRRRIGVIVPFSHQKMKLSFQELRKIVSLLAEVGGLLAPHDKVEVCIDHGPCERLYP